MHSQIFKKIPSKKLLYDFLENVALLENNYYILSKSGYKSAGMKNLTEPFLKELRQYYYKSKLIYIDKSCTYKGFITVLRQVCKINQIPIHSFLKYSKSEYFINYKILVCKGE
jgi:hypothetical protein